MLARGNLLFLHSGFIWDSGSVISIGYSLLLTSSDSLQGSKCPAMEYLLHSGTRQTSQLTMSPTRSRTDRPPYHLYSTYCCAWPSYRCFSGPFGVCAKTSIRKWDTGCVTTCTAATGTATEWLFPIKPVGPVPPPSSSLDDSKKNKANPNNV